MYYSYLKYDCIIEIYIDESRILKFFKRVMTIVKFVSLVLKSGTSGRDEYRYMKMIATSLK